MAQSPQSNHTIYQDKIYVVYENAGNPTIFMCIIKKLKNTKLKLCGFQTSNAKKMEKHSEKCENQPYPSCQYCNHQFASHNAIKWHQEHAKYCKNIRQTVPPLI